VALLLTVWLLTLLAVIAGEIMASGRVKAAAERNKRDDLVALSLALAGYQAAVAFLDSDIEKLSLDEDDRLLVHYRGQTEPVVAAASDQPLEGGTFSWSVSDEGGLVNINTAASMQIANLLQQCGLGLGVERDTVIDSILDWRDSNREHHLNGAEEDYYRGLDPPYSCKDGDFDVVEELLLVRGIKEMPRLFYGGEVDGKKVPGLRDLVTPYNSENKKPNPSTAPKAVREALNLTASPGPAPPPDQSYYKIVASGKSAGNAPPRSLRAVVRREDDGSGGFTFTLVYYNDMYIPE
jgi:general secretion pathway protein K